MIIATVTPVGKGPLSLTLLYALSAIVSVIIAAYQHHEHERRRAHDEHGGPRWQRRSSAHHLRNLAGMVLAGPGAGMLLVA